MFSLVFVCFRFTEISYFLDFPSNENVRKQHLSGNFCVNMKFSYTIVGLKDENFCRIVTERSEFLLVFKSTFRWQHLSKKIKISIVLQRKQAIDRLFVEDVYIFPIISCRKHNQRIADLFFLLRANKCLFIITNFLKINTRRPCLRTIIVWAKNDDELIIYSMIILDTTALLTREVFTDHVASEIRFWSL